MLPDFWSVTGKTLPNQTGECLTGRRSAEFVEPIPARVQSVEPSETVTDELHHRLDECGYFLPVVERRVETLKAEAERIRHSVPAGASSNEQAFAKSISIMAQLQEAQRFHDVLEMRMIQLKPPNAAEGKTSPTVPGSE